MYKALQSQIRAAAKVVRTEGIEAAKRQLDRIVINEKVFEVVSKIYKTVGVYFANDTYSKIIEQVETKGFGFNAEWIAEIINYFKVYLLNKAVLPISDTTRRQILAILIEAEQNGWGVDETARKLEADELTMARARMIVRTENAKAAFKGRELGKAKAPYLTKSEWIAANDLRTRHSHRKMDGVVVTEGEKFQVPRYKKIGAADVMIGTDAMIGPGDPEASKENVINCRCTTAERVVFDAEDNPVMKQTQIQLV